MCSNAIAGLNSCPGFHVPGQWLQGKVWIEHQWTFIIRWCHFKKADFPLLLISQKTVEHMEVKFLVCRPCICRCEARSWGLRNTGLRNVTVWKFSKDAKRKEVFEGEMKRIENFFLCGTWEIWKKTKLKISIQKCHVVFLIFVFDLWRFREIFRAD